VTMSSVIASVKDLITSMFEVTFSVFTSAFDAIYGLLLVFINFFAGIFTTVLHMAKSILEGVGGVGKFIASNIVVIAIIACGGYGYLEYQRRQGRPVDIGGKRLN